MVSHESLALLTDLYKLTMAQSLFQRSQNGASDFQSFCPILSAKQKVFHFCGPA